MTKAGQLFRCGMLDRLSKVFDRLCAVPDRPGGEFDRSCALLLIRRSTFHGGATTYHNYLNAFLILI